MRPAWPRAGDPSFDIPLDIVAIRPRRPLPRLVEILWRLLAEGAEAQDRDDIRPAASGGRHAGYAAAAVGAAASRGCGFRIASDGIRISQEKKSGVA